MVKYYYRTMFQLIWFSLNYTQPTLPNPVEQNPSSDDGTHGRGEKSVQGFGGKARRKESTWKTEA
jgi:hypothetical protein